MSHRKQQASSEQSGRPERSGGGPAAGYEQRDAPPGRVIALGLGLALLVILGLVVAGIIVARFAQPVDAPPPVSQRETIPQGDSNQELERRRQQASERRELQSYGWSDREKNRARVPIERAIELVGEREELPELDESAARGVNRFRDIRIEQKLNNPVPLDCRFVDAQGRRVQLGDLLDGRPVVLNLVYFECPMLCNLATNGLIRSLRALSFEAGQEFTVITVSFDPREGPEMAAAAKRTALKRYGRAADGEGWHFLTGKEESIRRLADAVGFRYRFDPESGQYLHAAGLMVLTPAGRVSRYLFGIDYAPRDLRLSLVEAAENKIGTTTDQVLLLCYQYDPATGKYGLLIHNSLRVFGVATVLVIGSAAGLLLWREHKRREKDLCEKDL